MILLGGLLFLAFLPYLAEQIEYAITRGRERARADVAREELAGLPDAVNRFSLAAKAVEPCVVGVRIRRATARPVNDEWWSFGPPGNAMEGLGSGVIVDPDGYIITNFHVINGANEINVTLSDGRTYRDCDVQRVGEDPGSDIAVLKVNASGLTAAPWGDSDRLDVGDQVLAMGSPYGLAQTVTAGIVSAKERRGLPVPNIFYQDFLQTDAAVNPGNSGGPLVSLKGQVVGINTAIYGERYQGISFAIPSRIAQDVYNRLRQGEKIARGWLGVKMQPLTDDLARNLDLGDTRGALVNDVVPESPAATAGVTPYDVIVQWNDRAISNENDLRYLVASASVGEQVRMEVVRSGKRTKLAVTVGQRPPLLGP
jgi:serine protease Do